MAMSETDVAGVAVDTRHWIGGRRVPSPATFTDLSPIDGQPVAEVAAAGEAEVTQAVQAAGDAFAGWAGTVPPGRAAVLHAIADGIERRIEDLSQVETRDNGSLLRSHRRSVMPRVAQNFRFFADWLTKLDGGGLEISGHREQVSWAPAGVTAVITPWNAPLMLATWRIAPALAAGNTVVAKPPEWAPLTASLLADITRDAGMPDGVFNVVQGLGAQAGAALVAHPDVARIAFTGSAATGRLVAAAAGAQLTPVSLELGGKSPLLVFADADLDLAVAHASGSMTTPGRCAWPAPGCWSRSRSPGSSSRASPSVPPRCGRAIRAMRPPTSARTSPATTSPGWTASSSAQSRRARGCCSAGR
jgi:5-carboxymethyl-2-hydroxymuconic-semialdehyde dehydrogenase